MRNERDAALLVVMHADLRKGQSKHTYAVAPRCIKDIAGRYGDVVESCVYADSEATDDIHFRNEWEGAGFRLCPVLRNKIRADNKKTTVIRSPLIQCAMPRLVQKDVATYRARVVVFVATHEVPPHLFAALHDMGVKIVVLAPDPDAPIREMADAWLSLRDCASANGRKASGLPTDGDAPASDIGRYVASPEFERRPSGAFERLYRDDPETAELLGHILGASVTTKDSLLTKLRSLAEGSSLPRVVLAALFILAAAPLDADADAHFGKNAYYARLLALDIDVDVVGRFALDLLAEKGALAAVTHSDRDVEYRFVRDPDNPSHALARAFCGSMVPDRNRIAFADGLSGYADEVAQALEIFCVDPADLTTEAAADIRDFLLLHLKYYGRGQVFEAYARRGIRNAAEARRFEQRVREILGCPAVPLADDGPCMDDDAPRISVCTADDVGAATRKCGT